jgi:hypothetical protein
MTIPRINELKRDPSLPVTNVSEWLPFEKAKIVKGKPQRVAAYAWGSGGVPLAQEERTGFSSPFTDVFWEIASRLLYDQWTAQLEKLRAQVEILIEELRTRPIVKMGTLMDIGSTHLTLLNPVQIVIEQYEDEVTASWPELEVFGSGDSDSEAILALKRDIVSLYEELCSTPDSELGALALGWKRTLQGVIGPDGSPKFQSS